MPHKAPKPRKDVSQANGAAPSVVQVYTDIEERRLKEWENYQKSHRSMEEANANRVFLDIAIGEALAGRLVVELFDDVVPETAARFRRLVTGADGVHDATDVKLDYLYTPLELIDKARGYARFGDLLAYGVQLEPLRQENFKIRHTTRGLLTMTSYGPHLCNTSFGITLAPAPSLDYEQVVFGKVVDGLPLLEKLEAMPVDAVGRPLLPMYIVLCGTLTGDRPPGKWTATQEQGGDEEDAGMDNTE
ncbi:cyclophilin 9 putative (CYP9) [Leptomonas pyrrhocoris]|uniref:Peptidyl-prolyl cis-trans isomerase n=1 Tax=Leptomonas pyrrhocoris TaxID=157538 RepID=A0A0M9G626_LEPPY|nr:cyclophilin 9 putative (CYP9) [Leptomonas pyrrhocoris]KPA82959.1 cyclophilin 9 putative (CYP9) [Leptomonas pyrrhocoris]|eukprot:XP_015661398.1 cyclophilin 9 putative (CYP9) [Leptomonas pyrrhocoris]